MTTARLKTELRRHVPYTVAGALCGILLFVLLQGVHSGTSYRVFYILHPIHVFFSAMATAALYQLHRRFSPVYSKKILQIIVVGYAGSIVVATLSDSLIPYLGEILLDMPETKVHIGFIEKWWLINPLALAGAGIAVGYPKTRISHSAHVLLSTFASLFHMLMAAGGTRLSSGSFIFILLFLFLAVWIPCSLSDIIVPVLVGETQSVKAGSQ